MCVRSSKRRLLNDTFHRGLGPVLIVAQCFGLMPIAGVLAPDHTYIKFKWISIRTILTLVNIWTGLFMGVITFRIILLEGINLRNMVGVIFFVCCTMGIILFMRLASKWRDIMAKWRMSEESFLNIQLYPAPVRWSLAVKIQFTSVVVFLLAVVEHVLYTTSTWYNMYFYTITCHVTIDDWWHYFFTNHFVFMFSVLPYHVITTLYLEYSNFALTISWNFMDLFIMVVSIGIATRFKQLNHRLKTISNHVLPAQFWKQIRCDYVQLSELVEYVDGHLAPIILLSCTNNLYFICFQLLNIFNSWPHPINKVYFWFSLLYLIARTVFVYLCAATIHDASKVPLELIRSVPSGGWCTELERFAQQVRNELVALSGGNFFYMTRTLLFGIAGTVVTYELVLLQFDKVPDSTNSTISIFCADKY